MAWTRKYQMTAEHRILSDLTTVLSTNIVALSQTQVRSGAWAYRSVQRNVFGYTQAAQMSFYRANFWMYLASAGKTNSRTYLVWAGLGSGDTQASALMRVWVDVAGGNIHLCRFSVNSNTDANSEKLVSVPIPAELNTTGAWFPVGVVHKVHPTAGFYTLYISGIPVITLIGDTRPSYWTGSAQAFQNGVTFVGGPGGATTTSSGWSDAYLDDFYIDESDGSDADEAPPSRRFGSILITGAGANAQFTPSAGSNYQNVDENPHDSDTTRNTALAAGLRDTFNFDDLFTLPAQHGIVQVIPTAFAKRLDVGVDSRLSLHAYDGSLYEHSANLPLAAGYNIPIFAEMPLTPDGSAWDVTKLNAMQFGYESQGVF